MNKLLNDVSFVVSFVFFIFLKFTLLKGIFQTLEKEGRESADTLTDITENTKKHARILLYSCIVAIVCWLELPSLLGDQLGQATAIAIAITTVMGVAWFVISFGAVPSKFLDLAFVITEAMFFAFCGSMVVLYAIIVMQIGAVAPLFTATIGSIFVAVYMASVLYDSMDLLKAGIDEESLTFYRSGRADLNSTVRLLEQLNEANGKK